MRTIIISCFLLSFCLICSFECDAQNWEDELSKYGKFESEQINQDLIQELVEQGALNRSLMNLDMRFSYDIPSILISASNYTIGFRSIERYKMKALLQTHNMLTPTVAQVLSLEESEWNIMHDESMRYTAICYAAIKDHLNSEEAKLQIVENLHTLKFGDYQNSPVAKAYIKGEVTLEALLDESPILSLLEMGRAKNDEELYPYVEAFFDAAFSNTNIKCDLSRAGNIVTIVAQENIYTIDLDYVKYIPAYDIDGTIISEAESQDLFLVGKPFYSDLLQIAMQIGVDFGIDFFFDDIYEHAPPYVSSISDFIYPALAELCPLVRFDAGSSLFLVRLPKENYAFYTLGIGTSFDFHPNSGDRQLKILDGILSNAQFQEVELLTTKQKEECIAFLNAEKSSFNLKDEELNDLILFINRSVFSTLDELLQYVPNIKLEPDDMGFGLDYDFSSAKGNIEFKDVFPDFYAVLKEDFIPTLKYNEDERTISFTYNGAEHNVSPRNRYMFWFIKENLKATKSGKQIYEISFPGSWRPVHYYLTPGQKEKLTEIANR